MMKYNPNATGNPAYLTQEGIELLRKEPHRLDAIKIHTDYINNVLEREVQNGELTKVILMDHLDWYFCFLPSGSLLRMPRLKLSMFIIKWRLEERFSGVVQESFRGTTIYLKREVFQSKRCKFVREIQCTSIG